jgi:hypothetical protein
MEGSVADRITHAQDSHYKAGISGIDQEHTIEITSEDSVLFKNVLMGRDDDAERKLVKVQNPHFINGVVYYDVTAYDRDGEFACDRRYSDFQALRDAWKKRIPGLLYPSLPPKKLFGNTDSEHIEERCFLLEQFMLKVYSTPYLVDSDELAIFARVENPSKRLEALPQQSVLMLLFRIRQAYPSLEDRISAADLQTLR